MSFLDEKTVVSSPVDIQLNWKGKDSDWFFTSYSKETQENTKYDIGRSAIVNIWFMVKWFNEQLNNAVYSNKIDRWDEKVVVRAKWDILAEWLWSEIKDKVSWLWGSIHKVVTLLELSTWKLVEIYLKGQAGWWIVDKETKKTVWWWFWEVEMKVKRWMNVVDWVYPAIEYYWVKLIKGKAFNYNVPEFIVSDELLSEKEWVDYINACGKFNDYKKALNEAKKTEKPVDAKTATEIFDEAFIAEDIDDGSIPF